MEMAMALSYSPMNATQAREEGKRLIKEGCIPAALERFQLALRLDARDAESRMFIEALNKRDMTGARICSTMVCDSVYRNLRTNPALALENAKIALDLDPHSNTAKKLFIEAFQRMPEFTLKTETIAGSESEEIAASRARFKAISGVSPEQVPDLNEREGFVVTARYLQRKGELTGEKKD